MTSKTVPKYIASLYGGAHGYRVAKRRELRAVRQALEKQWNAGAALPERGSRDVGAMRLLARDLSEKMSVKNWGR